MKHKRSNYKIRPAPSCPYCGKVLQTIPMSHQCATEPEADKKWPALRSRRDG